MLGDTLRKLCGLETDIIISIDKEEFTKLFDTNVVPLLLHAAEKKETSCLVGMDLLNLSEHDFVGDTGKFIKKFCLDRQINYSLWFNPKYGYAYVDHILFNWDE